ncbi:hypothetical protein CEXT_76301, partial [Caerostris extrusa]
PSNGSSLKDLKCTLIPITGSHESRIVIFRYYLPVPGVGNVRVYCLPWMWWQPFLRLPLRNRTLFVTRYDHGRRITYHRQLIRQTLERYVAGTSPCDQPKVIQSHGERTRGPIGFWSNKKRSFPGRSSAACINSRIATVIHVVRYDLRNHNRVNEPFADSPSQTF